MCGSSPEPEAVTRSAGMGVLGFVECSDFTLASTRSISNLFVGPRFDPPDAVGSYPAGPAAEWPRKEISGLGKRLADDVRPDQLSVLYDQFAIGLPGKHQLRQPCDHQRVNDSQ